MKQLIRATTFETNSSSIHTLSLQGISSDYVKNVACLDGVHVSVSSFGWEFEVYNSPIELLTYLYTFACSKGKNCAYVKKLKELLPNVIFDEPDYDIYENGTYLDCSCGYIDHYDEYETDLDFLFQSIENLSTYLFTGEVRTGNDNSDTGGHFDCADSYPISIYKGN